MSRKAYSQVSKRAQRTMAIGQVLGLKFWGDPNWAIAEAVTMETPIGEVHLHWMSHRGQGHWNIISNPQWRGEICGTARCRRVVLDPLGGENESANLGDKVFDEVREDWLSSQWGASCMWPRVDPDYPPFIHRVELWQDHRDWEKPPKLLAESSS